MIKKTTYDLVDLFEETFSDKFKDKFDKLVIAMKNKQDDKNNML